MKNAAYNIRNNQTELHIISECYPVKCTYRELTYPKEWKIYGYKSGGKFTIFFGKD